MSSGHTNCNNDVAECQTVKLQISWAVNYYYDDYYYGDYYEDDYYYDDSYEDDEEHLLAPRSLMLLRGSLSIIEL